MLRSLKRGISTRSSRSPGATSPDRDAGPGSSPAANVGGSPGSRAGFAVRERGWWRAACLAPSLLAPSPPAEAIVGPAAPADALSDHVVMVLEHRGATAGFCTGIVLAPRVVMTAAHCAPGGATLAVHYPDAAAASPVLLPVVAVARHPGYRPDAIRTRERSIDLALLRLDEPLPARFSPAALGTMSGTAVGASFEVAGYGLAREGEAVSSGKLMSSRLVARTPLSAVLLWAGDPEGRGAGACTGDSGGPVLAGDGTVVALTLWASGRKGRDCGDLTQALWLAPLRPWIDRAVADWTGKASP